jgi:hydroxysqualene synthase
MQSYPKYVQAAYEHCRKIALGHYENFPVGSILLPARIRPHFFGLYAFMRTADDFADLAIRTPEQRLDELRRWRQQLSSIYRSDTLDNELNPIFLALRYTVREFELPKDPLEKLLDAFDFDAKGDVRFESYEDLLWYCERSANPVGELVLRLFGYSDAKRIAMSNSICTGLQLLNFCQDVREDVDQGRCYFALDELAQLGISDPSQLREPANSRKAVLGQMQHVERLIREGTPLAESVRGRLRYELRAVVFGAQAMLGKLCAIDGNSYLSRPKLSKAEHFRILLKSTFFKPPL